MVQRLLVILTQVNQWLTDWLRDWPSGWVSEWVGVLSLSGTLRSLYIVACYVAVHLSQSLVSWTTEVLLFITSTCYCPGKSSWACHPVSRSEQSLRRWLKGDKDNLPKIHNSEAMIILIDELSHLLDIICFTSHLKWKLLGFSLFFWHTYF